MRDAAEVKKEVDAVRAEHKMPLSLSELGTERDALYEQFDNLAEATPKEEPKEQPKEEPKEEPKAEPEKAEFFKEDKPTEEEKKVPLGALHEEREKRKALAKEVAELKASFQQAVEDNKKLMDLVSSKSDDEPITDYEKEMLSLRKQLKVALTEIDSMKRGVEKEKQVSAEQRLESLAKQADSELEKAGYEGFYDFIPQVIKAMNDEEIPMEDRSPETWKRVYRDIVYPKYIGKHKVKPDKKAEKEELKKEASLVKTPGKPEERKKEEDDTPESYAKWRQKQSFFHNPI